MSISPLSNVPRHICQIVSRHSVDRSGYVRSITLAPILMVLTKDLVGLLMGGRSLARSDGKYRFAQLGGIA